MGIAKTAQLFGKCLHCRKRVRLRPLRFSSGEPVQDTKGEIIYRPIRHHRRKTDRGGWCRGTYCDTYPENREKPIAKDTGNGTISVNFDGVLREAKKIRDILLAQEFEGVRTDIINEVGVCFNCGADRGFGNQRERFKCSCIDIE